MPVLMKVLKFGGTSVGSSERMGEVALIIQQEQKTNGQLVVVCSAMSGVTDQLVELCHQAQDADAAYEETLEAIKNRHRQCAQALFGNNPGSRFFLELEAILRTLEDATRGVTLLRDGSARSRDIVMSFGERLSCLIVCELVREFEPSSVYMDARHFVKTDRTFGNALVDFDETNRLIRNHVHANAPLRVVTGFIGSSMDGETTTLGRGGSDYTAAIFGAALSAQEIQIWTDVDGVLTADPKMVAHAKVIQELSYEEAMELSHFGAKVIYAPTMQPALEAGIPIRIKNTLRPDAPGTLIGVRAPIHGGPVTGLSAISDIAVLRVHGSGMVGVTGTAGRLFNALAQAGINIILISQGSSEHSICFAIRPEDAKKAVETIHKAFELEIHHRQIDPVSVEEGLSVIAVVGERMRATPGISGRLFSSLGKTGVNVVAIAQGSSERNISVVVKKDELASAMRAVHHEFFWHDKTIHVFVVGTGLIGSTLLSQISQLNAHRPGTVEVHAICNSTQMLLSQQSLDLTRWRDELSQNGGEAILEQLVHFAIDQPFERKVFVDATASVEPPLYYERLLDAGVSVVTPNKKAASGNFETYQKIKQTRFGVRSGFGNETNVGAGLPIIGTLRSLLETGDEIKEIHGVFSGTMSYLFNNYDGTVPFSALLSLARQQGYTEPDPRDDLSGMDVARKLLILAREIGIQAHLEDVEVENLTPEPCRGITSVEEFFQRLPEFDGYFLERLNQAKKDGKRLRYVGRICNGKLTVALTPVLSSDPCFSLTGPDNLVAIQTRRYDAQPLVIRGPGAGAEVTAAGVLLDILHS